MVWSYFLFHTKKKRIFTIVLRFVCFDVAANSFFFCEEELNRFRKERIKIVEDGGVKLKNFLVQKDPFPKLKCDQKKCLICGSEKSENLKITCNTHTVGYKLECDTCLDRGQIRIYEGESSRSARIRGQNIWQTLRNRDLRVYF